MTVDECPPALRKFLQSFKIRTGDHDLRELEEVMVQSLVKTTASFIGQLRMSDFTSGKNNRKRLFEFL
jgi:hypothetical protein